MEPISYNLVEKYFEVLSRVLSNTMADCYLLVTKLKNVEIQRNFKGKETKSVIYYQMSNKMSLSPHKLIKKCFDSLTDK